MKEPIWEDTNYNKFESLSRLLEDESVNPHSVLASSKTPEYPYFFAKQFPDTNIVTFDKEKQDEDSLIAQNFITETLNLTNYTKLEEIIQQYETDFVYTSDLLDHLDDYWNGEFIADILANNNVKWILFLHNDKEKSISPKEAVTYNTFRAKIEYYGYKIRRLTNLTQLNHYLAISPAKKKMLTFKDVFGIDLSIKPVATPTAA